MAKQTTTGYRCGECGQTAVMHPWDAGVPECGGKVGAPHDVTRMRRDKDLDGPLALPEPDARETPFDEPAPEPPAGAAGSLEAALGAGAEEPAE